MLVVTTLDLLESEFAKKLDEELDKVEMFYIARESKAKHGYIILHSLTFSHFYPNYSYQVVA